VSIVTAGDRQQKGRPQAAFGGVAAIGRKK